MYMLMCMMPCVKRLSNLSFKVCWYHSVVIWYDIIREDWKQCMNLISWSVLSTYERRLVWKYISSKSWSKAYPGRPMGICSDKLWLISFLWMPWSWRHRGIRSKVIDNMTGWYCNLLTPWISLTPDVRVWINCIKFQYKSIYTIYKHMFYGTSPPLAWACHPCCVNVNSGKFKFPP